mmetsp:Transcript_138285/g.240423  ORF Transcript_138285/g.240423 Transcript_138285/m.240423 type:complete len:97 (+) Transcript_138285:320-610(+)
MDLVHSSERYKKGGFVRPGTIPTALARSQTGREVITDLGQVSQALESGAQYPQPNEASANPYNGMSDFISSHWNGYKCSNPPLPSNDYPPSPQRVF